MIKRSGKIKPTVTEEWSRSAGEEMIRCIFRIFCVPPQSSQNSHHKKKSTNNKCWRGCGEKRIVLHC